MSRLTVLISVLFALALLTACGREEPSKPASFKPSPSVDEKAQVQNAIENMYAAMARGDVASVNAMYTDESRKALEDVLAEIGATEADSAAGWRNALRKYELRDFKIEVTGNTARAQYVIVDVGGEPEEEQNELRKVAGVWKIDS